MEHLLCTMPHAKCFTRLISLQLPSTPLSRCHDNSQFTDEETEVQELKNLPTVTARKQGKDSVPGCSLGNFGEVNSCYQLRWEDGCQGQLSSQFLLKKWPFLLDLPIFPELQKTLFSQLQILVLLPVEKWSRCCPLLHRALFSYHICVSHCLMPLGGGGACHSISCSQCVQGKSSHLSLAILWSCSLCVTSLHDIRWPCNSQKTQRCGYFCVCKLGAECML